MLFALQWLVGAVLNGQTCLVVVAHSDDEALWFASELTNTNAKFSHICDGWEVHVTYAALPGPIQLWDGRVVASRPTNPRCYETDFYSAAAIGHYTKNSSFWKETDNFTARMDDLFSQTWPVVATHNALGDYGHPEHIRVHNEVRKYIDDPIVFDGGYVIAEESAAKKALLVPYADRVGIGQHHRCNAEAPVPHSQFSGKLSAGLTYICYKKNNEVATWVVGSLLAGIFAPVLLFFCVRRVEKYPYAAGTVLPFVIAVGLLPLVTERASITDTTLKTGVFEYRRTSTVDNEVLCVIEGYRQCKAAPEPHPCDETSCALLKVAYLIFAGTVVSASVLFRPMWTILPAYILMVVASIPLQYSGNPCNRFALIYGTPVTYTQSPAAGTWVLWSVSVLLTGGIILQSSTPKKRDSLSESFL